MCESRKKGRCRKRGLLGLEVANIMQLQELQRREMNENCWSVEIMIRALLFVDNVEYAARSVTNVNFFKTLQTVNSQQN